MKTILPSLPPDSVLQTAMNLAITHAQKLSRRAGIGWVLLDREYKPLLNGGVIAGADPWRLPANIERFREKISILLLSIEPLAGLVDQKKLFTALENSNCDLLVIDKTIHITHPSNAWRDWLKQWHGQVIYLPLSDATLTCGPQHIFSLNRPWVTCVSAADIYGNSLALSAFERDFGVTAYLNELCNQSRAVLYSTAQAALVEQLPEENFAEEPQEFFAVDDARSVAAILQNCAAERRCSVVIFCDMALLATLLQKNLVDEITHHIAVADYDCRASPKPLPKLPLQGWQQISCVAAGNCTRIHLRSERELVAPDAHARTLN